MTKESMAFEEWATKWSKTLDAPPNNLDAWHGGINYARANPEQAVLDLIDALKYMSQIQYGFSVKTPDLLALKNFAHLTLKRWEDATYTPNKTYLVDGYLCQCETKETGRCSKCGKLIEV